MEFLECGLGDSRVSLVAKGVLKHDAIEELPNVGDGHEGL